MKFVRGVWKQLQNICVADQQYDQHQEGETCRESHGTVGSHRMLRKTGLNGLNRLQLFAILSTARNKHIHLPSTQT
jgi:hypothetical protein